MDSQEKCQKSWILMYPFREFLRKNPDKRDENNTKRKTGFRDIGENSEQPGHTLTCQLLITRCDA